MHMQRQRQGQTQRRRHCVAVTSERERETWRDRETQRQRQKQRQRQREKQRETETHRQRQVDGWKLTHRAGSRQHLQTVLLPRGDRRLLQLEVILLLLQLVPLVRLPPGRGLNTTR
jgi:hypothetical protein